jgi:hypothetical protein
VVKIRFEPKYELGFFFLQGQRLHQTPNKELEKFGIFNGNYITLIGPKVGFSNKENYFDLFGNIFLVIRKRR